MKTPKEYTNNIKKGIITTPMLLDCLFSVNKRAKNWRDKEREYRRKTDPYNREERARNEKERYYGMKETMLSVLHPVCVHRETIRHTEKERIYDYDEDFDAYDDRYWECKENGLFVYEGSYWSRQIDDYVHFGDIITETTCEYRYYLFYDIGGAHTFHTPISEQEAEDSGLKVVDIGSLTTYGDNIDDLISPQFVQKVVDLIRSEQYQYVEEAEDEEEIKECC